MLGLSDAERILNDTARAGRVINMTLFEAIALAKDKVARDEKEVHAILEAFNTSTIVA